MTAIINKLPYLTYLFKSGNKADSHTHTRSYNYSTLIYYLLKIFIYKNFCFNKLYMFYYIT